MVYKNESPSVHYTFGTEESTFGNFPKCFPFGLMGEVEDSIYDDEEETRWKSNTRVLPAAATIPLVLVFKWIAVSNL